MIASDMVILMVGYILSSFVVSIAVLSIYKWGYSWLLRGIHWVIFRP